MKIVVLGGGESGVGAALLAKAKGLGVFLSDAGTLADKYKQTLQQHGIAYEEGGHSEAAILSAQEVIKSPGIPEKAEMVKKIRAAGIGVISEIEFAARYTRAKLIAITGTNGKTTTTLLTYHLLKQSGWKVGLAGNVGHSFAQQVIADECDWYVLEISSFQLDDCYRFAPQVAVLLNITPDHLDRYQYQMQHYIDAKFRLLQNATPAHTLVYYSADPVLAQEMAQRSVSAQMRPITDSLFGEGELLLPGEWGSQAQTLHFGNLPLRGKHNMVNMSAAIAAVLAAGLSPAQAQAALPSFVNAPHRMQLVHELNGVAFVNDSKATNVDAAAYALDAYNRPLVWIVGGVDKGNDYAQVAHLVRKNVRAIVCMGTDNAKPYQFFKDLVAHIADTHSLAEAMQAAFAFAQPGDVVLLSPACASFDLFKNYEDRGQQFAAAAKLLGQHQSLFASNSLN